MLKKLILFCLTSFFTLTSAEGLANAPSYVLKHNKWEQLVFPVRSYDVTIDQAVGNVLSSESYNVVWAIFGFDPTTGAYVAVGPQDSINPGSAYWIIQRTGQEVELSVAGLGDDSSVSPIAGCASEAGCQVSILRSTEGEVSWQMLGSPFDTDATLGYIRIGSGVLNGNCFWNGCSLQEADDLDYVAGVVWAYDSETEAYRVVNPNDTLPSWQGFWFAVDREAPPNQLRLLSPDPEEITQQNTLNITTTATTLQVVESGHSLNGLTINSANEDVGMWGATLSSNNNSDWVKDTPVSP